MSNMIDAARGYYQNIVDTLREPPVFATAAGDPAAVRISGIRKTSAEIVTLLDSAQKFELDDGAAQLLAQLLDELGDRKLDMFKETPLPFQDMWLERQLPESGQRQAVLITSNGAASAAAFFALDGGHFSPALQMMTYGDEGGRSLPTPHFAQALANSSSPAERAEWEEARKEQTQMSIYFFGMAKAMATLLNHPGMLERREHPALPSRAERRRAERSGKNLPATRVTRLTLGEFGRGQMAAMDATSKQATGKRRAHWVRGHFMRNRSGGTSWRMPHIRGAGPIISQERKVTAPSEHGADPGL